MVEEHKSGLMVRDMMGTSCTITRKVMGGLSTRMATSTKAIGSTIGPMDMVSTPMLMEPTSRAYG